MKYVIETTNHSRKANVGEKHTEMNQISLKGEKQELNTPVKENEEDTNETELDESKKMSDWEAHQGKGIENIEIEAQKEENRSFDIEDSNM